MYKLVLSYDIQNEKGESILMNHIPNAASFPIEENDAKDFSGSIAQDRLSIFLTHFLATGFLVEGSLRKRRGIIQGAKACNYEIYLPLERLELQYHHSSTEVSSNISLDEKQVLPYNLVVKSPETDCSL